MRGQRCETDDPPSVQGREHVRPMAERTTFRAFALRSAGGRFESVETLVSGCVEPRINGEQRSPLAVILGAGGDSERWVGV